MTKQTYEYNFKIDQTDRYFSYSPIEEAKKRCFEGIDLKLKDSTESYLNTYIKNYYNGSNTEAMKNIRIEVFQDGTEKYIDDLYDWLVMTIYPYKIIQSCDSFKMSTNIKVARCLELCLPDDYS